MVSLEVVWKFVVLATEHIDDPILLQVCVAHANGAAIKKRVEVQYDFAVFVAASALLLHFHDAFGASLNICIAALAFLRSCSSLHTPFALF